MISDRFRRTILNCLPRGLVAAVFLGLAVSPAVAQQPGGVPVSDIAGAPDAVLAPVPGDACTTLYETLSVRITAVDLRFGPVKLDHRPFFRVFCGRTLNELKVLISAPAEVALTQAKNPTLSATDEVLFDCTNAASSAFCAAAKDAKDQVTTALFVGFWTFMAEQLYAALPAEEQAKYTPLSADLQQLAHRWLNEAPPEAFETFAAAYLANSGQEARLLKAWMVYVNSYSYFSVIVLQHMDLLLTFAQGEQADFREAKARMETEPYTPWADALYRVGLSAEWAATLRNHEGAIRALDTYEISGAVDVLSGAVGIRTQAHATAVLNEILRISGAAARTSDTPLTRLINGRIDEIAAVVVATLDELGAFENARTRTGGFCIGDSNSPRTRKSLFFEEINEVACPLSVETWPLKHVYETQGAQKRTFFFDGMTFVEARHGDVRAGVTAARDLVAYAATSGVWIDEDPDTHIAQIAAVFNTSYPGGVPALIVNARKNAGRVVRMLAGIDSVSLSADNCSPDQIRADIARAAGLPEDSFADVIVRRSANDLARDMALAFVGLEGLLGSPFQLSLYARGHENYADLADRLSRTSVLILEGRVQDGDGNPVPAAVVRIDVSGGREVRGCEVQQAGQSGRFLVTAIGTGPSVRINVRAAIAEAEGGTESFDLSHFQRKGTTVPRPGPGVTGRATGILKVMIVPEDASVTPTVGDTPESDTPDQPVTTGKVRRPRNTSCDALDQAAGAVETRLSSGTLSDLDADQRALFDAFSRVADIGDCTTGVRDRYQQVGLDLTIAGTNVAATETLLLECRAGPAQALLDRMLGAERINYGSFQARLTIALSGIRAFDQALEDYKKNNLDLAETRLTSLASTFGKDCPNYAARIERGLAQIATLRQFGALLSAAIQMCDRATLQQMEGQIANRDHVFFDKAQARITAALASCAAPDADQQEKVACDEATAALTRARDSYKAGNLTQASADLAAARASLAPGASQLCPDIAGRIAQGEQNIAAIRAQDTALEAARAACDTDTLEALRERALGQSHVWFRQAIGRIDAALGSCAPQTGNACDRLFDMRGDAEALMIAGEFAKLLTLMRQAQTIASDPVAVVGCEGVRGEISDAIASVTRMTALLSRVDPVAAGCDGAEIDALLAEIEPFSSVIPRFERARTDLIAARDRCQTPEVTPEPPDVFGIPPEDDIEDPGSALAVLQDAIAKVKRRIEQENPDDVVIRYAPPSGDHQLATVRLEITVTNLDDGVPTSRIKAQIDIEIEKYETEVEAVPIMAPGERRDSKNSGYDHLYADEWEEFFTVRFSKRRFQIRIRSELSDFVAFNEEGKREAEIATTGVALFSVGLGGELRKSMNPDL